MLGHVHLYIHFVCLPVLFVVPKSTIKANVTNILLQVIYAQLTFRVSAVPPFLMLQTVPFPRLFLLKDEKNAKPYFTISAEK